MRKILFLCGLIAAVSACASAQRTGVDKTKLDEVLANKAVVFNLTADKPLLEPDESANLVIKVTIPPTMDENGSPTEMPYDIPLPIGAPCPYKAVNWRIVAGGGRFVSIDEVTQQYFAPTSAPPGKTMTIAVDLQPLKAGYAKVELLQTLYWVQNETAIYVNMPQIGLTHTKFIGKADGGVAKVPTMQGMDPRAAAGMPADVRAKIAAAQAQVAAAQAQNTTGINLGAVTSNAMSIYDPEHNITAIKFKSIDEQMNAGHTASGLSGIFMFNFKGKGVGTYPLNGDGTGLGLDMIAGKSVACGMNQKTGAADMKCTGSVTITSIDDNFVKGTLRTSVYTMVDKYIYKGYLYGTFTVNRAR